LFYRETSFIGGSREVCKRKPRKGALLSIGTPLGGLFTGASERQMNEDSENTASLSLSIYIYIYIYIYLWALCEGNLERGSFTGKYKRYIRQVKEGFGYAAILYLFIT
jgi:hypothetical protein